MSEDYSLPPLEREEGPWNAGWVVCQKCGHESMAVWPEGPQVLECSCCGAMAAKPGPPCLCAACVRVRKRAGLSLGAKIRRGLE